MYSLQDEFENCTFEIYNKMQEKWAGIIYLHVF